MKVKFTLQRAGGNTVDLAVTFDSSATVGDLADYLAETDPDRQGRARQPGSLHTLALVDRSGLALDRTVPLAESSVQSGAMVGVLPAGSGGAARPETGAATLSIIQGPGAGTEIALPRGSSTIGRERSCDVTLGDAMVSREHARVNVTDVVEIFDLGSANGTLVGESAVSKSVLRPDDVVQLGDTRLTIRLAHTAPAAAAQDTGSAISFVRSPTITPRFEGAKFEAPQPPERGRPQRFPWLMILMPLLVGAVLVIAMPNSLLSLVFVVFSPLMLIGSAYESRRGVKADFKEAVKAFDEDLAALRGDLERSAEEERAVRTGENPSSGELVAAALRRTPILWSRRYDGDAFVDLRIGIGAARSRSVVDLPRTGRAPHELRARSAALAGEFAMVAPVPVPAMLNQSAVGVAGPRRAVLGHATSLMLQAAILHSPAELAVAAFLSAEAAKDWDWLKWLPHTSSVQSPLVGNHLAVTQPDGSSLVTQLEDLVGSREPEHVPTAEQPGVIVLVEHDPPAEHNRLVHLAEVGPTRGVYLVWLAAEQALLPAACKIFVHADISSAEGVVGRVVERSIETPVDLDTVSPAQAESVARSMAPVLDLGARVTDSSDLPRTISQLHLVGTEAAEGPQAVLEKWGESNSIITGPFAPESLPRRAGTLRAVIGQSATGTHTIDLRTDGPHALVGGTTGAGKSELLQSWVLGMAANHSPQRVNFLFVDYKGGSAFADCAQLPHSTGVVTDLSPHLVRRALQSLSSEVKYREDLLVRHKAKDLVQMERMGLAEAPPSLVLVVDEFAALVQEVPEFVDGVVDVAQRGRSLGLHLILATQRPAGVIKENLRANTNLRIALRMADPDDSVDVLGTQDAAFFDPAVPGRAMSRSGPRRLVPFQSSYSGGWTSPDDENAEIHVEELNLSHPRVWARPDLGGEVIRDEDQTDIKRLVRQMQAAQVEAEIPDPRLAWLPELPGVVNLKDQPVSSTDDRLLFALADDPERQAQPPSSFVPDRDSNIVIYGTSGSGKSTALRTLALSAGYAARQTPVQVYGLDFGSRGLSILEDLPHVGSIIPGSDHERVTRLLRDLRRIVDERVVRYSTAPATNLTEYRQRTGQLAEPRILVLVDGLTTFRQNYETGDRQRWVDLLSSLLADGRPAGVHFALTSDQRLGLTTAMAAAIPRRLVMRMASSDDYSMLGVPVDVLDAQSPPGRALDGELELQVAILGKSPDVLVQAEEISKFATALGRHVEPAPEVKSLGDLVALASLPRSAEKVVVGLDSETLGPLYVEPSGGFLVTGASGSGRSTALATLVASARTSLPPLQWHFLGERRSPILTSGDWQTQCLSVDDVGNWAIDVGDRFVLGGASGERHVLVIEAAGDYVGSMADMALQQLVRTAQAEGHWVIAEGESSTLISPMGFLGAVKTSRTGIALQPDQEMGSLFKTPFPRTNRAEYPPGRALMVRGGRVSVVQVAVPWDVDEGADQQGSATHRQEVRQP